MARKNDMQRIADASAKLEASSPEYTLDQKLAARTLVRRTILIPMAAISAGGTLARTAATGQWKARFDGRLLAADFIPSAAAAASDTNNQTINAVKNATVMAAMTTNVANGSLVAGTSAPLTLSATLANQRFAKGDMIGPSVAATGAGVAIAAGTLQLEVELEGPMSDFPV